MYKNLLFLQLYVSYMFHVTDGDGKIFFLIAFRSSGGSHNFIMIRKICHLQCRRIFRSILSKRKMPVDWIPFGCPAQARIQPTWKTWARFSTFRAAVFLATTSRSWTPRDTWVLLSLYSSKNQNVRISTTTVTLHEKMQLISNEASSSCPKVNRSHSRQLFLLIADGVLINIECKAWAHNIIHDRFERRGSVHFELMVD